MGLREAVRGPALLLRRARDAVELLKRLGPVRDEEAQGGAGREDLS